MTEYYAKITPVDKGMFRCAVMFCKTDPPIDTVLAVKKFIRYNRARKWAEKKVFNATLNEHDRLYIREQDLTRRGFNNDN
jgi:hypothetical protein